MTSLYEALLADAEDQPPNWDLQGRQANIWKTLGYIPSDVWEPSGTNTKQVSRTLEYSFDDFTISQVAKTMGKTADGAKVGSLGVVRAGVFDDSLPVASTQRGRVTLSTSGTQIQLFLGAPK